MRPQAGEDTRLSLQGGAGIKVYLAPSEQRTRAELSAAVGKTTHRVVSKSKTVGRGPFNGINISERNEERDLLTEDEAGRLKPDEVIVLANGQHPIRAWRIKYFEDRVLKPIFEAQSGPLPAANPKDHTMRDVKGEIVRANHRIDQLATQIEADKQKRSRVRAVLPSAMLGEMASPRREGTGKEKWHISGTNSVAKSEHAQFMRRRRVTMDVQAMMLSTQDEAVEALRMTTQKVDDIAPPGRGTDPSARMA